MDKILLKVFYSNFAGSFLWLFALESVSRHRRKSYCWCSLSDSCFGMWEGSRSHLSVASSTSSIIIFQLVFDQALVLEINNSLFCVFAFHNQIYHQQYKIHRWRERANRSIARLLMATSFFADWKKSLETTMRTKIKIIWN